MLFIVTGGTIDKLPVYLADGKTFDDDSKRFGETHVPEILRRAKFMGAPTVRRLFMIDSLEMTDDHREVIADVIGRSVDKSVVVTHGTDTMPETARYLDGIRSLAAKTVVLTGAMVPYSVDASDAEFNIGAAVAYARCMPSGVYVAMNGQAFEAGNVRKDLEAGVFRTLE